MTATQTLTGLAWMRKALSTWKPNKIDPNLQRELKHGWMVNIRTDPADIATSPILFELETLAWGRWDYLARTVLAGKLLDEPIPQIDWDAGASRCAEGEGGAARNHLEKCLDLIPKYGGWLGWNSWTNFDYFLDWLLYAFGHPGQPELPQEPSGCEGASMRLYQYFNLAWLIAYPWDYFGAILALNGHGKRLGFYPTPMSVCTMMAQMTMGLDGEDCRAKTTMDCCLGTGRMLLVASNYSMRLSGQDINPTVIKASLVNGYLYAPWMVRPIGFLGDAYLSNGDKLTPEGKTVSEVTSDRMTAQGMTQEQNRGEQRQVAEHFLKIDAGQNPPAVADTSNLPIFQYLNDTEHDTEEQWKFEPIKKRRKKGVDLPAGDALKPVKASSKTGTMIALMARSQGAAMQELLDQVNPNESSIRVYFSYDLKKKGYGVKEDATGNFHLVLPAGVESPLLT